MLFPIILPRSIRPHGTFNDRKNPAEIIAVSFHSTTLISSLPLLRSHITLPLHPSPSHASHFPLSLPPTPSTESLLSTHSRQTSAFTIAKRARAVHGTFYYLRQSTPNDLLEGMVAARVVYVISSHIFDVGSRPVVKSCLWNRWVMLGRRWLGYESGKAGAADYL